MSRMGRSIMCTATTHPRRPRPQNLNGRLPALLVLKTPFYFYFFIFCNTLYILFWKFEPPCLGKATAAARAALLSSPTSACWVFSNFILHRTLTWPDYRLFNVRTCSFLCVPRIHTGVGNTDNESAQHFRLGKKTSYIFFLCS